MSIDSAATVHIALVDHVTAVYPAHAGTCLKRIQHDDRFRVGWLKGFFIHHFHRGMRPSGKGSTRAEDARGTPAQGHVSPSILVYEDNIEAVT